jgi:hypothetical protein
MTTRNDLSKKTLDKHLRLAWSLSNFASGETLVLESPDFENQGAIPVIHASNQAGGKNLSPALRWTPIPQKTAHMLLIVQDPDAPTPLPFIHCLALLDNTVTGLAQGALDSQSPSAGVRLLRAGGGPGYLGPAPPKSHGPHKYVFQLFALAEPLKVGSRDAALDSANPRVVFAAIKNVLARGRLDGFFQRR